MTDGGMYTVEVEIPERLEISMKDINHAIENGDPTPSQTKELREIKEEMKQLIKRLKSVAY